MKHRTHPHPCLTIVVLSKNLINTISWTEKPGGLPSMGSHRVGHDRSDLAAATVENMCANGNGEIQQKGQVKRKVQIECFKIKVVELRQVA